MEPAAKSIQPLTYFSEEEQKLLKEYYGAPPALLAGIEFVKNAERRPFLAELTETANDLTTYQPIRANLPYASVRVAGKFKIRSLLDSGSTHTICSKAMYDVLAEKSPEIKQLERPTGMGFRGVGEGLNSYACILSDLEI